MRNAVASRTASPGVGIGDIISNGEIDKTKFRRSSTDNQPRKRWTPQVIQNRILPPKATKTKNAKTKTPFQTKLKKRCRAVGIHFQKELAARMNTSQATVSRWFSGDAVPDMYQAIELATILKCTVEWLCRDGGAVPPDAKPKRKLTQDESTLGWIVRQVGGAGAAVSRILSTLSDTDAEAAESIGEILTPVMN